MSLEQALPYLPHEPRQVYPMRKIETILTAVERPINDHLLRLLVVPDEEVTDGMRRELLRHLNEVLGLRHRLGTVPEHVVFFHLYDEPFGEHEETNIPARIWSLREQHQIRDDMKLETVTGNLRRFHRVFSGSCQRGIGYGLASEILPVLWNANHWLA